MGTSVEIDVVKVWSRRGFSVVKRGKLTALNVVQSQD
jgi:hypothetical protein